MQLNNQRAVYLRPYKVYDNNNTGRISNNVRNNDFGAAIETPLIPTGIIMTLDKETGVTALDRERSISQMVSSPSFTTLSFVLQMQ